MSIQLTSGIRLILLIFISLNFIYTHAQSISLKKVSGYVTHNNIPLKNAHISIKDSNRKTITNENGHYFIETSEREIIRFSFVGMIPLEIVVEDVTKFLNVKMSEELNNLDTVFIQDNQEKKNTKESKVEKPIVVSAYGSIDKNSAATSIQILENKDLWPGAVDIIDAIQNHLVYKRVILDKFGNKGIQIRPTSSISTTRREGAKPNTALWDIDGMIYENNPPHVDLADVEYVAILRSISATTLYGKRGSEGVIVVNTKGASKIKTTITSVLNKNNQSNYDYLAKPFKYEYFKAKYINILNKVSNDKLYSTYKTLLQENSHSINFFLDVAQFLRKEKGNKNLYYQVLGDMYEIFYNDPEALKALAYMYQVNEDFSEAIKVYYRVAFLRPSYKQSFRDLANAYIENKQYKEGWDIYMRYLHRGYTLNEKGIEEIVYSEMKWLHNHKKDEAEIKELFVVKDKEETSTSDIRLVFEWNTSEAEFELEFVDPELNSFTFEHSLAKNSDRIADEKLKGYSSNEFFIYDTGLGNWIVNAIYLGNKNYEPTYLKATIYKNWGRENQSKEIRLFTLTKQNYKMQLLKLKANFVR